MKKTILFLMILFGEIHGFSQDSIVKKLTRFRFDLQVFGNSPVFSAGVSKSYLVGEMSLVETRLGAGFFIEQRNNVYTDGYNIIEKKELEPVYSIPIEFTFIPNYKNRFSFSMGGSYYYFRGLFMYADTLTLKNQNYRAPVQAFFFSVGADYNFKNKLYLGIRLLTAYEFEKGYSKNIPLFILPNIRCKF